MFADSLGFFANPGKDPHIEVQRRPGVSVIHVTSVPSWVEDPGKALEAHQRFKKAALANKDVIHVRQASDVPVQAPHTGILFGMQHAPQGMTLGDVQVLANAGVQFMALACEGPTEYGNGFNEDGPLTTHGKYLLGWMAMCGMTLDVSSASNQTAIDALEFIRREELPLVPLASHSGVREVYDYPRNVSFDVLLLLKELNGYIGIPLVMSYICPAADIAHFDRHFLYHVANAGTIVGLGNVGIGSDCVHRDMARGIPLFASLERVVADGFQSLKKAEAICGGNFLNYLKRALPR